MKPYRGILLAWIGLFALAATEFGFSYMHFNRSLRPMLIGGAILMASIVAIAFMRVRTGPGIVRGFAIGSLFWLTIMLGLATSDPMTRAYYAVHDQLSQP